MIIDAIRREGIVGKPQKIIFSNIRNKRALGVVDKQHEEVLLGCPKTYPILLN